MSGSITLGPFELNVRDGRLICNGVERDLRPQAVRVLKLLAEKRGQFISYDQLAHDAWDAHVSRHTVATTVNELRHMLGEYGSWIVCRPKIGYGIEIHSTDDLIRRGWHFRNQYTREGFENAIQCFQRAAAEDPSDFRAFEAIANTYLLLAGFLMRAPSEMAESFTAAHARAVSLCGDSPALRLDRAFGIFVFERNTEDAGIELRRLQKELPQSANVCVRLALIQLAAGRVSAARVYLEEGMRIDPLAPELAFLEIVVHLFGQEFDEAVKAGRRAVELHPGAQIARAFYAEALDFAGHHGEAMRQYRLAESLSPDLTWVRADEARSLALHGSIDKAAEIMGELENRRGASYVDAYHMALAREALGQRDKAIREIERACDENSYALLFSVLDAKAASLRAEPRIQRLRKRITRAAVA